MIECVVFSCDRAMQLDNLLTSINKCCPNLFTKITILYNTTRHEFELGYQVLFTRYPKLNIVKETDFKTNVLDILKNSICEYTCLIVDDAIFYTSLPVNAKDKIKTAFEHDVVSFILGVGENTTWSMTANISFEFPKIFSKILDMVYIYNWKNGVRKKSEFECPFMLVGNIYMTSMLYNYSKNLDFKQPNSYEIKLQMFVQQFYRDELPDNCGCFDKSVVLHSPNNCVQREWGGGYINVNDALELNKLYLNGYIIDYDSIEFGRVDGLHKSVNLKFSKLE